MEKLYIYSNIAFFMASIALFFDKQYVSGIIMLIAGIVSTKLNKLQCKKDGCLINTIKDLKIDFMFSLALCVYLYIYKKISINKLSTFLLVSGFTQFMSHRKGSMYQFMHSVWHVFVAYGFY